MWATIYVRPCTPPCQLPAVLGTGQGSSVPGKREEAPRRGLSPLRPAQRGHHDGAGGLMQSYHWTGSFFAFFLQFFSCFFDQCFFFAFFLQFLVAAAC